MNMLIVLMIKLLLCTTYLYLSISSWKLDEYDTNATGRIIARSIIRNNIMGNIILHNQEGEPGVKYLTYLCILYTSFNFSVSFIIYRSFQSCVCRRYHIE